MVGAKERPVMRSVALDLAKKDIAFCEVRSGEVVARGTAADVRALERMLGTQTPKARVAIEGTDLAAATEATRLAIQDLDKAASKGVIHARNAARRKSRLMKQLHAMSQK